MEEAASDYSVLGKSVAGSAIDASMSVLAAAKQPIITFAMGSPAADAIPNAEIAQALVRIMSMANPAAAFDYSPTEGNPALRVVLLDRLRNQGQAVEPECLLITAGGMQGLDLVYRLFVEPGDLVLAESPSYANGTATARNHGAMVVQVPLDDAGLDIQAARQTIQDAGRHPKLFYLIPTYQNPSGGTYTLERRLEVLKLATDTGALILEDDPYSELRYGGESHPSLLQLDEGQGHVIQVRTFSKIVAPGLRVGWVIAPRHVTSRMVELRQTMDTCANSLAQMVIADLIETGRLDTHITRLRALYPKRRDAMDGALRKAFGAIDGMNWTSPDGGMFIWLTLPSFIDGDTVLAAGLQHGVAVVPGSAFDPTRTRNAIRLCFSAAKDDAISLGVARLHETILELTAAARSGT